MKRFTSILSMLFLTSLMFGITLHAQIAGETCINPLVVTTLPFTDAGNTSTYGNNYSSSNIPPFASNAITNGNSTSYISGDEVVYEYTPTTNEIITISLTGVGTYTGLYAFSGCPFASTVGSHTNSAAGTRSIPNMPVIGGVTYYFLISTWATPQSTAYNIEVTKLSDCSGTPVAGNITGPSTICVQTAFSITMDNPIVEGGISYQWQSSIDAGATWSNVTGAIQPNYSAPNGINVATDFRLIVSCAISSMSDTTNVISMSVTSGPSCVCIPTGGSNNSASIINFVLGSINNSSLITAGVNGYSDYTQSVTPADLLAGLSYTATMTSGADGGNHGAAIWIDYNNNGIFEATEKVTFQNGIIANSTVNFPPFLVPNNPGTYRLRVQYVYNQLGENLIPCSVANTYAETEDYMVNVLPPPTCIPPNTLIATNLLATSATVSWTGPSPAPSSGYEYYYSTSNTAPTANTTPSGTSATASVNLTSLTASTQYYFWSRSVCSSNDISVWSSAVTFTTPCAAETAPWTYDVEAQTGTLTNSVISGCWTGNPVYTSSVYAWNVSGTGTTPSSTTGPNSARSGTKYFYTEASNGAIDAVAELLTPIVDVTPLSVPVLEFYYHMYGSTMGDLYIEVSDGTTWTVLDSLIGQQQTAATDPWLKKLIPLTGYTGNVQVKFKSIKKTSYYGDGAIDDISIIEAPSCLPPSALTVTNVLATSATVSWSAPTPLPGSGYEYYYSTSSSAPTASTTPSGTSATLSANLTSLTPSTQYYFWVRSVCSSNSKSSWSVSSTFTTPCVTDMAPWFYDVEAQTGTATNSIITGCWTGSPVYSSSVYAWNVSGTGTTPSSNTGPSSAYSGTKYFYTEASYGATDANAELLTPLVDVTPLNVPALEFYYHMYGSSQGDLYIEVSDGTTWTIVDSIIGEQQTTATDPWLKKMIPLQGYTGTIQVKFRSVKKASFYGDMAIDDIGIVEAPLACAGIPVAGIVSTVSSICPATSFDLEGNEIAALGITYQWQQSPAGLNTWTNLTGATNFDYAVSAGIMVATDFRLIVTCTNSNLSDTSNVVSVTLLPGLNCHCTPVYTIGCNNGAQVGGVTTTLGLTNISNTGTGCTQTDGLGYTDYSATHSASAAHSNMVDIKVDVANYGGGVKIWVDWNQNGVFEATELMGASASTIAQGSFYQTSFIVPSSALTGPTKMRVRVVENSTTFDACSSASYGEAEDYEFVVVQGTPCAGMPSIDTIQGPSEICASTPFMLSLDPVLETGITYVWQSSPLGLNTWTTIVGVNSSNYTNAVGITNAMDYRVIVTCTNSNLSDTTDVHSLLIAPGSSCYCEPSYSFGCSSDNINNFILVGEIAPGINNLNTPCPPTGYFDYSPTMSASLLPGNTYSGNVTTNYSSPSENVRIWIDYNQNGIFEASETVATLANLSNSSTGAFSFTVPPTTASGTYKMRVRLVYGTTPLSIDPCTVESFGETHDYTILVDGLCTDPIVDLGPDATICEGESITLDAGNAGLDFEWNDASTGQTLEVSTSGTYYVTVTDDDCSTTDTIVVTVQDLPIVNLGADVSICEGASITLDAGNAGADYLWSDNSTNQTLVVTDEGTYAVTVTEGTCFASDTVEVSYLDGPSADGIIANEQNDCFFTFSVNNAQNATYYEWDFGDGSPATIGAAVNYSYSTNGAFIVTLTMANDCEDTLSITHEVVCDGIGIQDVIADKNAITLYPNPTTDLVTIESQNNLSMEQVTVYNVLGQTVYQNAPMSQFKHSVDVSKMASGVYTIHVQTNNGVIIRKFEIIK